MSDWNDRIVAEFRDNEGRVGGPFAGSHLVLLTTTGAKSGHTRVSPMMYFEGPDPIYVIASKAGAPTHPAWFHNLSAHPEVSVEVATDHGVTSYPAVAEPVVGAERDELFAQFAAQRPGFAGYQEKTDRIIPVIRIRRAD